MLKTIFYEKGNLVDAFLQGKVNVLMHQANCFKIFGGGIAKEIKERIPQAYKVDALSLNTPQENFGHISGTENSVLKTHYSKVINLYGQYKLGSFERHTHYGALANALNEAVKTLSNNNDVVVGMPKLGCGLGGGDWKIVSELVEYAFRNFRGKVVVYEL